MSTPSPVARRLLTLLPHLKKRQKRLAVALEAKERKMEKKN